LNEILKTTLIGLFFGTFGTTIGGIIGITFKRTSNKFLSFVLAFASGLMLAIICFDLIPEAMQIASIVNVLLGIILGIIAMIVCDILVQRKFNSNNINIKNKNSLLKTGIIVSIGLALHNFPEGLAIGSGFGASITLGYSLAIAICLHDIPERNINGSTYEKWRNEQIKSNLLRDIIRNNNRNWSFFWSYSWRYFKRSYKYVFKFCSRCNVVYCIRRTNSRIK